MGTFLRNGCTPFLWSTIGSSENRVCVDVSTAAAPAVDGDFNSWNSDSAVIWGRHERRTHQLTNTN